MSATEQIDGTAVVTSYFEDRITAAEKGVAMEAERDTFVREGSLHPAVYNADSGQPEWAVCQWAQTRISRVAFKDMTPAGDRVYNRLRAEEKAAHTWLRKHGYTVPAPFGEQA